MRNIWDVERNSTLIGWHKNIAGFGVNATESFVSWTVAHFHVVRKPPAMRWTMLPWLCFIKSWDFGRVKNNSVRRCNCSFLALCEAATLFHPELPLKEKPTAHIFVTCTIGCLHTSWSNLGIETFFVSCAAAAAADFRLFARTLWPVATRISRRSSLSYR